MDWLGTSLGTAALVAFVLENLKKATWFPWLSFATSKLNSLVALVIALATSLGINYMWDESTRNLTVHIPTVGAILLMLWQFGIQWALQKFVYRTGVKEPQPVTLTAPVVTAKPIEGGA